MKKKYQGGLSSILLCTWKVILGNKGEGVGNDRQEQHKPIEYALKGCLPLWVTGSQNYWGRYEEPHEVCLRIVPLE